MKKIFRNVVAAFAAVMLVSAFASCSDSDDDDDKKTEQTTSSETTATIFSEEVVLTGWSNGKVISEDKFASAKAGDVVRFVASGDNTPDGDGNVYHSFKIAANSDWAAAFKEFSDVFCLFFHNYGCSVFDSVSVWRHSSSSFKIKPHFS